LTAVCADRYDRGIGGLEIPDNHDGTDFDRLERVVSELADAHGRARRDNAALRRKLEDSARRVRTLEGQLLEANQKRQDVAKRIDELIGQLDHLDTQLAGPKA